MNMATVHYAAFVAVTLALLRSPFAAANFTFPFFGDEACKTNVCGKGSCVASTTSSFGFECECEKGWKQADTEGDHFFKFLPCVIPNCTLNFDCAKSPDPAPKLNKSKSSVFDPCFWTDCGGGSCNKTSLFTHSCVCEEGYYNLFNSTSFPCYKECAIGGDCANLGITAFNSSNSRPPQSTVGDSTSHASSLMVRAELSWLIVVVTTLAPVVWKYS